MIRRDVGVALSGGGYRATAWSIGALAGLLRARDLEKSKLSAEVINLASIASVSGGSIANGFVLGRGSDLNEVNAVEFEHGCAPLVQHVAHDGLIFFAASTNMFVYAALGALFSAVLVTISLVGGLAAIARDWTWWFGFLWASVVLVGLALTGVIGRWAIAAARSEPTPPALQYAILVAGAITVSGAFGLGALVTRSGSGHGGLVGLVILAVVWELMWLVAIGLLSRRGQVIENRLGVLLQGDDGHPRQLASRGDRSVHHVFCATELQSGDQFYFSPRLVYGYQFGVSHSPGTVTVARAVQASAALPLGFPPQRRVLAADGLTLTPASPLPNPPPAGEAARVVLADGGVYDNMGTEWELGFANRTAHAIPDLTDVQAPANFLIVANAGKALGWKAMRSRWRVLWELLGPLRDQSIQYDQTTAPRRTALIRMFRAAEQGDPRAHHGIIAQASTSVYAVAKSVAEGPDTVKAARAQEWLAPLLEVRGASDWAELARESAAVPTTLHPLGAPTTLNLIKHACVLTQLQLHIHYGIGEVDVSADEAVSSRFAGGT